MIGRRRGGASSVAYALVLALVAIAVLSAIAGTGGSVGCLMTRTANLLGGTTAGADCPGGAPTEAQLPPGNPPPQPASLALSPASASGLDVHLPAGDSDSAVFTVANTGGSAAGPLAVRVDGPFVIESDSCAAGVPAGGSCSVSVYATAAAAGPLAGVLHVAGLPDAALAGTAVAAEMASCNDILQSGQSHGDGIYTLSHGATQFDAYCDMSWQGGGWTMVAAQFEAAAAAWDAGRQLDYDPTLVSGRSFALGAADIPPHAALAWGRADPGGGSEILDAASYSYGTGSIPATRIASIVQPSKQYWIARDAALYYDCHEIDGGCSTPRYSGGVWANTLTIDPVGTGAWADFNWAYDANQSSATARGYAYAGASLEGSSESFAWALWVR